MIRSRPDRRQERAWAIRNSLWVLTSLLSFGCGAWAGFLYIGLRARDRQWLGAAVVCAGFSVHLGLALLGVAPPVETRLWVFYAAVQAAIQLFEIPRWLRWLAAETVREARAGAGEPALRVATDRPSLDVNVASVEEFVSRAGVDPGWAAAIVEIRTRLGRFASIEQLAAEANVDINTFGDLDCRLTVGAAERAGPEAGGSPGRRLELP